MTKVVTSCVTGGFTVPVTGLVGDSQSFDAYTTNSAVITQTSVATFPVLAPEIVVEQPAATSLTSGAASIG